MNKKSLPEPCLLLPEDKMQKILDRLDARTLEKYQYLQAHKLNCEINRDQEYKSFFSNYYQMQMTSEDQRIFFDILEREKGNKSISFNVILKEIYKNTGRRQSFYSSSIVHTSNPKMPIWNKNLIYDLSLKEYYDPSRGLDPYNKTYLYMKTWADMAIKDAYFTTWVEKFDEFFPDFKDFTDIKKLDLFFWRKYIPNMRTRKPRFDIDDIMHHDKDFFVRTENLISESGNKKSPHQALNNDETENSESMHGRQIQQNQPSRPTIIISRNNSFRYIIEQNDTGISFDFLLPECLKDANKITLTDPYIHSLTQRRNLDHLLKTILKIRDENDEVNVHLITTKPTTAQAQDEQLRAFNDFRERFQDNNNRKKIILTWEFGVHRCICQPQIEPCTTCKIIHDRHIVTNSCVTNSCWAIDMGRGLDIFYHSRGNLESVFENLRCKPCKIIYTRDIKVEIKEVDVSSDMHLRRTPIIKHVVKYVVEKAIKS